MEQMNYGGMQGKGQKNNIGEKTEKDDKFAKFCLFQYIISNLNEIQGVIRGKQPHLQLSHLFI